MSVKIFKNRSFKFLKCQGANISEHFHVFSYQECLGTLFSIYLLEFHLGYLFY